MDTRDNQTDTSGRGLGRIVAMGSLALGLMFSPVLLTSCAEERTAGVVEETGPTAVGEVGEVNPDIGASVNDILEEPNNWIGRPVVVSGEIEELVGPRAFTIGGEGWLFTGELLVIGARPWTELYRRAPARALAQDDIVQVWGTVRRLVVADIERELGFDLDAAVEAEFRDKPVVIANRVVPTPRAVAAP